MRRAASSSWSRRRRRSTSGSRSRASRFAVREVATIGAAGSTARQGGVIEGTVRDGVTRVDRARRPREGRLGSRRGPAPALGPRGRKCSIHDGRQGPLPPGGTRPRDVRRRRRGARLRIGPPGWSQARAPAGPFPVRWSVHRRLCPRPRRQAHFGRGGSSEGEPAPVQFVSASDRRRRALRPPGTRPRHVHRRRPSPGAIPRDRCRCRRRIRGRDARRRDLAKRRKGRGASRHGLRPSGGRPGTAPGSRGRHPPRGRPGDRPGRHRRGWPVPDRRRSVRPGGPRRDRSWAGAGAHRGRRAGGRSAQRRRRRRPGSRDHHRGARARPRGCGNRRRAPRCLQQPWGLAGPPGGPVGRRRFVHPPGPGGGHLQHLRLRPRVRQEDPDCGGGHDRRRHRARRGGLHLGDGGRRCRQAHRCLPSRRAVQGGLRLGCRGGREGRRQRRRALHDRGRRHGNPRRRDLRQPILVCRRLRRARLGWVRHRRGAGTTGERRHRAGHRHLHGGNARSLGRR